MKALKDEADDEEDSPDGGVEGEGKYGPREGLVHAYYAEEAKHDANCTRNEGEHGGMLSVEGLVEAVEEN